MVDDPAPEIEVVAIEDDDAATLGEDDVVAPEVTDGSVVADADDEGELLDDETQPYVEADGEPSAEAGDVVAPEVTDGNVVADEDEEGKLLDDGVGVGEADDVATSEEEVPVASEGQPEESFLVEETPEPVELLEEDEPVLTAQSSQSYDTMSTARSISLGYTYSGSITSTNERDFYRFTLPSAGRVTLTGSASIPRSNWRVYDASGNQVWSWTYAGANGTTGILTLDENIDLKAGTYYFCAERYSTSYTGSYSFKLSFASAGESFSESNNSMSSASLVSLNTQYKGQLARNDDKDFYRFTLPSAGRVTLTGSASIPRSNWRVYDASGNQVWYWTYAGANGTTGILTLNEKLDLTAGTYYFCAERYDTGYTGNYSFKLSFASAGESFSESNNSVSSASLVSLNTQYKGQLARNDDKDFYKFTLPSAGRVTLTGSASIPRSNWRVYDASGNQMWYWTYAGANDTTGILTLNEKLDLTAGTYYFCAERYDTGYTGNYSFKLSFASAGESFKESQGGSDNTIATANAISLGTTYKGQIARNDDRDFYKFTVSSASGVAISINSSIGRANYYLYDSKGNDVWSKTYAWADDTTGKYTCFEKVTLSKGTYYFCVERYYNDYHGNYNFRLYNGSVKDNPMKATVNKSAVPVAYYKVKSSNQTLASNITVSNAQGTVTYTNVSSNATAKKFTVNKTTGKVAVPKGTRAGTYDIKVKVNAAGNANYRAKATTLTYKIKVYLGNTMTVKATKSSVAVAYSTVKSRAVVTAKNVTVSNAKGTVTYANASTNTTAKKFKVDKTTGKVTVPKGTAKGTYVVKVKVTAAGTAAYASRTITVSYYVIVK